ncbi:hypothetical protein AMTRI_Chr03g149660 [Amborella trichopoda]
MAKASIRFVLPLMALFILPIVQAKEVEYCDKKGNYLVKVSGMEVDPDPVERGKQATFSISASTEEPLSEGKLIIEVFIFGIHVHSETHDLCSETSCPIASGNFVLKHAQVLPTYTPPGSYTLKMKMLGSDGKQLTCINFGFSIGFGESIADI